MTVSKKRGSAVRRSFRGCFIGLDRYQSRDIAHLSSAVRDAEALHALFTDNLGEGGSLIRDEEGTAQSVRDALEDLQSSGPEDIVIVSFSGHGTSTHELVTFDADVDDLLGSCISLDELTELLSRIPARQLVCILDCCFAGGAGAKVLTSPRRPRSADPLASAEAKLDAMSGAGRLILTAAAADEPAWEDGRLGHGLLTYALLEALQGAEAVRANDRVPIYKLLRYVVEQVRSGALTHGARQTATLRGQMDGEITWPIFALGDLYRSRFPERLGVRVTEDIATLQPAGFPPELLGAWSAHIPNLNKLQQDAINDFGLLEGDHLLVSAPTSSGKTLLGELVALQATVARQRSVFLLPTRALVNDKYDHFINLYGSLGVRVVRATGEIADDVPALMRGQYDLALLTYEKFAGLVLSAPHLLRSTAVVVVDEVQTITDESRGMNLEFLLTLIRSRRRDGIEPQLVLLSAVLGDLNGFDSWLGARHLLRTERPVPLKEGVIRRDGTWRYLDVDASEQTHVVFAPSYGRGTSRDILIPLVRKLTQEEKQVIVFRNQRGATRGCAQYLSQSLGLPAADEVLADLPAGDPSGASDVLRSVLAGGVAFHNAELDRDEKQALERHFRRPNTNLRVIVATTTLAQGINTPAESVIVAELDHPAGRNQTTPYTVAEYKNIIGRAGRLGFNTSGESFLLVDGSIDEDRKWRHYVTGTPENLHSTLLEPSLDELTLVVRVLATASSTNDSTTAGMSADDVVAFLALSFAAHQASAGGHSRFEPHVVRAVLNNLVRAGLAAETGQQLELTELGLLAASGAATAGTVLRLADFFQRLPADELNRASIICAAQITDELQAMQMPVNPRGWQKERGTYGGVLQQQGAGVALHLLLNADRGIAIRRAKRAVGCLLWMDGAARREIDAVLTRHMPTRDGASYAQAAAARARDLIETILDIAKLVHPGVDLTSLEETLPVQLELGVPRSLVPIARITGQRLTRSNYLALHSAGLTDVPSIREATEEELLSILKGSSEVRLVLNSLESLSNEVGLDDITTLLEPPPVKLGQADST